MILRIKKFISNHYLSIILAVAVGFLMILPQVLFMAIPENKYAGINIMATDSESNFYARFQEVSEGDWRISDIFWTFNKKNPYQRAYLEEVTMYNLGRLFLLNVSQSFLFSKFILAAILFLAIYFFVLLFEKDKRIALSGAIIVMFWHGVSSISEIKSFLGNKFIITEPSIFSRPINPVSGIILLFAFLSFFYLYINRPRKRYFWLAGISLGLSFYLYFFVWSFLAVFVGVSFIFFWMKKDWLNLKKALKASFLAALISLPHWFNLYKMITFKSFGSSASQAGLMASNKIIIGSYLIFTLILYFLNIYAKKIKGGNFWLWTCLIISSVVILNQQIITQRIMQPGHYHWYVIKPLALILFIWFVFSLFQKKNPKYLWSFFLVFLVAGIYLLASQQISTYYRERETVIEYNKQYASVHQWINKNTEKNQIIFASLRDADQRRFISAFTHLDEYLYGNKHLYPISLEQSKYILFLEFKLDGIDPDKAKEMFFVDLRNEIFYRIYGYYYRVAYVDQGKTVSNQEVEKLVEEYAEFYKEDIKNQFKKYPVDYILWNKQSSPQWKLGQYDFLKLLYNDNGMSVYEFN